MIPWVDPGMPLPEVSYALDEPNGLLAAGMDLSPERLLDAYRHGIFPWYSEGQPVLWWSPDPRMVLFLDQFKVSRSLAKAMRAAHRDGRWSITHDQAFRDVMRACAEPRLDQDGTWINEDMMAAYHGLYERGHAHSVEVWRGKRLVGGLYGVAIGRMFYGESMFAREPDASKVALASLVNALRGARFTVIDCQQNTRHLASLGAREIPRSEFLMLLAGLTALPPADWTTLAIELPPA